MAVIFWLAGGLLASFFYLFALVTLSAYAAHSLTPLLSPASASSTNVAPDLAAGHLTLNIAIQGG